MQRLAVKSNILVGFGLVLMLGFSCKPEVPRVALKGYAYSNKGNVPTISVHRGGRDISNYPENCLETLVYVNDSIDAIFEVDVAQTKDRVLVLMHDNSVNRTTTGEGLIRKMTFNEISQLRLVDDYGTVTDFRVPQFSDVLKWSKKSGAVLTIDVKRSAEQSRVIEAIKKTKVQDRCILITYDIDQAKAAYKLAPELMLSVPIRNREELDRAMASRIPKDNMIAFTGTRLSHSSLYKSIHNEGLLCIQGTLGNLDKQAKARGDSLYIKWKERGIDIFATDRPFELNSMMTKN